MDSQSENPYQMIFWSSWNMNLVCLPLGAFKALKQYGIAGTSTTATTTSSSISIVIPDQDFNPKITKEYLETTSESVLLVPLLISFSLGMCPVLLSTSSPLPAVALHDVAWKLPPAPAAWMIPCNSNEENASNSNVQRAKMHQNAL